MGKKHRAPDPVLLMRSLENTDRVLDGKRNHRRTRDLGRDPFTKSLQSVGTRAREPSSERRLGVL